MNLLANSSLNWLGFVGVAVQAPPNITTMQHASNWELYLSGYFLLQCMTVNPRWASSREEAGEPEELSWIERMSPGKSLLLLIRVHARSAEVAAP